MRDGTAEVLDRVAALRQAFDQSFAAAAGGHAEETDEIIAIRVLEHHYGIRVRDISGVTRSQRIVPLPSSTPELGGLVQVRGIVLPVYSLAALLGYSGAAVRCPFWTVLCGTGHPLGLDIGELEFYARVPRSRLVAPDDTMPGRRFISHVTRTGDTLRAIIDVAVVTETIRRQTRRELPAQEQPKR